MKLSLPKFFVNWIIKYAQRTPYFHLPGYMERFWLIKYRRWFPYSARVHHILRSDQERHLHDHPWPYLTVILRGGYWEVTHPEGKAAHSMHFYGPGSVLRRNAMHKHRLILPKDLGGSIQDTWTLFFMGRKINNWGFYTPNGKIPWQQYLPIDEPNHTEERVNE